MSVESIQEKKIVKPEHLLVTMIDDEEVGHFIFQKLANGIPGVETAVFQNARTVIELIKQNKFKTDLILLDINMPHMNGWDFLEAFEPFNLRKPVFIVSSSNDRSDVEKSKRYKSVKGFFSKPISRTNLQTMVDLALSGSLN
jgi:CheY-like chemotaxis protein